MNTQDSNTRSIFDVRRELDCLPPSSKSLFNDPVMLEGRMTKTMTIILLIVAVMTISINLGVIIRVYRLIKKGGEVKPAFYLIGNLAVSDFLMGLYIVIIFCIDLTQFSTQWRNKCCGLIAAIVVTACEETICTITLIAVDKYIFICHGISYRTIVRGRRVSIAILCTWLFSLLIGFLPAFGLHESRWCACTFTLYINTQFAIVLFIASVVIPLAVIISLYAIILALAVKVTKRKLDKEKSKSKGIYSALRISIKTKSSKSSSAATMSTKISSTDTTSSSYGSSIHSNRSRTNDIKKGNDANTNSGEDYREQLPSIVSVNATRSNASSLPAIVELREVDLMPYELDSSSDDSDSEDEDDVNEDFQATRETQSPKHKTRFYDFTNPSTSENGESCLFYSGSYKQNTNKEKLQKDNDNDLSNVQVDKGNDDDSDSENDSLTVSKENNVNSENEQELKLRRKRSYFKKVLSESKDKVLFLQKCRAIKPILLILLCFTLTYVPFVTGVLAFKVQDNKSENLFRALNNLLYLAVVINSLINPFIYAYGYDEFRIKTKNFKGICAKDRRKQTIRKLNKQRTTT